MAVPSVPPPARPVIVTLALPQKMASHLDALRRAWYPPALNRVPAHLTLFRHLPGPRMADVLQALQSEAVRTPPFPITILPAAIWQEAVVLPVRSPELDDLRARLKERWASLLVPADRAPFRAHVTIANRLDRSGRAEVVAALATAWPRPVTSEALGLHVWRYDDGPWSLLVRIALRR